MRSLPGQSKRGTPRVIAGHMVSKCDVDTMVKRAPRGLMGTRRRQQEGTLWAIACDLVVAPPVTSASPPTTDAVVPSFLNSGELSSIPVPS